MGKGVQKQDVKASEAPSVRGIQTWLTFLSVQVSSLLKASVQFRSSPLVKTSENGLSPVLLLYFNMMPVASQV